MEQKNQDNKKWTKKRGKHGNKKYEEQIYIQNEAIKIGGQENVLKNGE